jgi:hypothetical protein
MHTHMQLQTNRTWFGFMKIQPVQPRGILTSYRFRCYNLRLPTSIFFLFEVFNYQLDSAKQHHGYWIHSIALARGAQNARQTNPRRSPSSSQRNLSARRRRELLLAAPVLHPRPPVAEQAGLERQEPRRVARHGGEEHAAVERHEREHEQVRPARPQLVHRRVRRLPVPAADAAGRSASSLRLPRNSRRSASAKTATRASAYMPPSAPGHPVKRISDFFPQKKVMWTYRFLRIPGIPAGTAPGPPWRPCGALLPCPWRGGLERAVPSLCRRRVRV